MLEYLLNYVDSLEKQIIDESGGRIKYNQRYHTVIKMKKFILEDMLPYFIDRDIEGLREHMPNNFMVQRERRKWLKFCTKYENYVDVNLVMNYFDGEIQKKMDKLKTKRVEEDCSDIKKFVVVRVKGRLI